MESPIKSQRKKKVNIEELYSLRIGALWRGFNAEHISFRLLCIYFLFEYIRPQTLYPVLDVLPWAQLFLLSSLFTLFQDKSITTVSSPISKLFVIFLIIVFLSGIFAYNPNLAWKDRNIMIGWTILYFLVIKIVNTEKRLIIFIIAYLIFNLKMSQHGAIGWAARGFSFKTYGLIGAPGWFRNSGEYSIQMLIYGSLALAFVLSIKDYLGQYKKWFLYAAAATGYIAVVGASSRGSQLGLAVIVILFLIKQDGGLKGILVLSIISYLLYIFLPEEQLLRFESAGDDNTSLQRLEYWSIGMQLTADHPVLGIGYSNWTDYLNKLYPNGLGPLNKVELPHNIFIQASAELGYTGLIIFLFMIITAFKINYQTRVLTENFKTRLLPNLSYGLDAGMVGYLVSGSFVSVFYYPFFWVQISMVVALNSIAKNMKVKKSD